MAACKFDELQLEPKDCDVGVACDDWGRVEDLGVPQ